MIRKFKSLYPNPPLIKVDRKTCFNCHMHYFKTKRLNEYLEELFSPNEIRVDEEASILPTVADLSSDGMVEKLRSEVKRIVVERMKEEAEQLKKSTENSVDRPKGTFIIRMDEKGNIVTEPVGGDTENTQLESFTVDAEEIEKAEKENEEEKKVRRAFITLLRMTVHLLLTLQDEQREPILMSSDTVERSVDLSDLSEDIRQALIKVFQSNKANINDGIAKQSIDDVLSSFRILWPENILPRHHFGHLEKILLRLARDPVEGQSSGLLPENNQWDKEKGEKLIQFMRSIRGEFATHLRQFYSKVADRSAGLNGVHEPKPNRTPDEL